MWECAGVVRNEKKLKEGLQKIEELKKSLKKINVQAVLKKNHDLIVALDTISLVNVAKAVLASARIRKESRAAHYRDDFKKISKKFEANIFCTQKGGNLKLWKKKVSRGSPEFERAVHKKYHRQFELWE